MTELTTAPLCETTLMSPGSSTSGSGSAIAHRRRRKSANPTQLGPYRRVPGWQAAISSRCNAAPGPSGSRSAKPSATTTRSWPPRATAWRTMSGHRCAATATITASRVPSISASDG